MAGKQMELGSTPPTSEVQVVRGSLPEGELPDYMMWAGDVERFLSALHRGTGFDLVVTSPPYNLGKEYEEKLDFAEYLQWQRRIIAQIAPRVSPSGSICWQVGNYMDKGEVFPLDVELVPVFREAGFKLRNRIVWRFGHGLHCRKRFSHRYEVVLWFTASDEYKFNLDDVRIPSKYPGKRHYSGPKTGQYSGHPLGKNPEDVWDNIPNVKAKHVEKTQHPCQFPVGLVQRLILALTDKGDLVFDPFAGVASAGVAAVVTGRRFWGCEIVEDYAEVGVRRMERAMTKDEPFRSHLRPIYDHRRSPLSRKPK